MAQPEETPAEQIRAQAAQPGEPVPMRADSPAAAPTEDDPATGGVTMPSPHEQAVAEAGNGNGKAKTRALLAKYTTLVALAAALVGLLVVTSLQVVDLSTKTSAASAAAKAATSAGGMAAQLRTAQSAAEASILVDAGCTATESPATTDAITKVVAEGSALISAEKGTSLNAFISAADKYINGLQVLSTDLQQDASLSRRASVKTAVTAVVGDLDVTISAMQDALAGNFGTSEQNNLGAAATRIGGDATAVDTLCGGDTLSTGSNSSGGGSGIVA